MLIVKNSGLFQGLVVARLQTWTVVIAILLVTACGSETEVVELPLRPVRYIQVEESDTGRTRTFSGISKSVRESRLSFKVPGTIQKIPAQVGDQLNAGDLIASIDPLEYQLQVQQADASLVQASASARNALANYDRVKGLYENANASRNDLDSARANAESAEAQKEAAKKALELARLNLSYTELRTKVACSIASIDVDLNENVGSGTLVARVNCSEEIEVEVSVPESLIASIQQGMPAQIRFDAFPGETLRGEVTEVGVASTGVGATFPITVKVEEKYAGLRSGLAAEVDISFAGEKDQSRKLLPLSAVIQDPEGAFVYVAAATGKDNVAEVERRNIVLGELTERGVEVLDGLAERDRVITAGVTVIRVGQRVLLQ